MNASPVPEQDGNLTQPPTDGVNNSASRNDVHLKLLIPNAAVGAVVGRGGESVSLLQQQTGTRIKMSRPNEFYPGTTDRVCLISGPVDSVAHSYELIVRKICERPMDTNNQSVNVNEEAGSPTSRRPNGERTKQVKLLVTNSTAGMVIGKGGSNIKEIKEESGALIQISQKSTSSPNVGQGSSHAERLITISGDFEELDRAVRLILRKIESDPQSAACASVSYADANANVNTNPATGVRTQPPHAPHQAQFGEPTVSPRFATARSRNEANGTLHDRSGSSQFDGRLQRNANAVHSNFANQHAGGEQSDGGAAFFGSNQRNSTNLDQIASLLRSSGYHEQSVADITSAMNTLIAYGLLSVNVDALNVGGSVQYSLLGGLQLQAVNGGHPPAGSFQQSPFAQSGYPQAAYPHAGLVQGNSGQNSASGNASYITPATPTPSFVNAGNPNQSNDDALSLSSASFSVPVQSGTLVDVDPNGNTPSAFTAMYDGSTIVPISVFEVLNQGGLPQLGGLGALNQAAGLLPGMSLANMQSMNLADALGSANMQQRYVDDGTLAGVALNGQLVQRELKVHESLIGVIFGVGGKWIADLQAQTGASIQVSKKGVYAQASHDRVVTIKGNLLSVTQASNMISQKLSTEEERRARRQPPRGDTQSTDSDYATTA